MQIKNVIFDLGGVLIHWNPQKIVEAFTNNIQLQQLLLKEVFQHQDWLDLDKGVISEVDAATKIGERAKIQPQMISDLFACTKQQFFAFDDTVTLLKDLHEHGIKLYVLSNMSKESWGYLKATHTFFNYFDDVLISGHEKLIKPDTAIYDLTCQRFDLSPEQTLFVDDMKYNILAARDYGLNAILFSQDESCRRLVKQIVGI